MKAYLDNNLSMHVKSSFIHSYQKLQTMHVSINRWMAKQVVIYPFSIIPLSNRKERTVISTANRDSVRKHAANDQKSHWEKGTFLWSGLFSFCFGCERVLAVGCSTPRKRVHSAVQLGCLGRGGPCPNYLSLCTSPGHVCFSAVQSLSPVQLWVTPWTAATRPPCMSPTTGACSNSCPSSQWCHPGISSTVVPFTSCLNSYPNQSGSFPMSQLSV